MTYTVYTDDTCTTPATTSQISPDQPPPVTVTDGAVPDSDPVSFSQAGGYFWQAVYSGDANNASAPSALYRRAHHHHPEQPDHRHLATDGLASDRTRHHIDSASLAGATSDAGGTVTYNLYANSLPPVCVADNLVDTATVAVSGGIVLDNTFTSVAVGNYELQAVYSGDANNNGATSTCGTEPFVVTQTIPTLTTALPVGTAAIGTAVPDSAALAGATTNAAGTVTYTIYTESSCTTPASTSQISAQPRR